MRIKKLFRSLSCFLLCLALGLALFPVTAFARVPIDTGRTCTLTVKHRCKGALVKLYRVADVSAYGEYTLTDDFKNYAVSFDDQDQTGWRALASTLGGYAARDKLAPLKSTAADENGNAAFTELAPGMYLVLPQSCSINGSRYTFDPFLAALPELDADENWVFDVKASPKYTVIPPDRTTDLEVLKVWKDGSGYQDRPKEITVQILRGGSVWNTVTLSGKNNWRYSWKDLDGSYDWQVVEKEVPDGYTVSVSLENGTFVVTNTLKDDPGRPGEPQLPQTGVLWWPVGVLTVAGMALFLLGCICKSTAAKKNRKSGAVLIICGLLVMAAALSLTCYNLLDEHRAANSVKSLSESLGKTIPAPQSQTPSSSSDSSGSSGGADSEDIPEYLLNPDMEMPVTELDGHAYIGVLSIPNIDVRLPVISRWSNESLKIAPCRYSGSAYNGTLVIAAHNYSSHFGRLSELKPGNEITFTDMDGNVFYYVVDALETLPAGAADEMVDENRALTLFTCTISGQNRVAVRCVSRDGN